MFITRGKNKPMMRVMFRNICLAGSDYELDSISKEASDKKRSPVPRFICKLDNTNECTHLLPDVQHQTSVKCLVLNRCEVISISRARSYLFTRRGHLSGLMSTSQRQTSIFGISTWKQLASSLIGFPMVPQPGRRGMENRAWGPTAPKTRTKI